MDGHNVIAVYATRAEAERARDRLIEVGIPAADIRISAGEPAGRMGARTTDLAPDADVRSDVSPRREGFWDWLFGRDVPEYDRTWYETNLREGHTVLSVLVHNIEERHRIAEILEDFNPIDFDETETRYRGLDYPVAAGATAVGTGAGMATTPRDGSLGSPQTWEHERDIAARDAAARTGERVEQLGTGE